MLEGIKNRSILDMVSVIMLSIIGYNWLYSIILPKSEVWFINGSKTKKNLVEEICRSVQRMNGLSPSEK